jgi:hypothetical protein
MVQAWLGRIAAKFLLVVVLASAAPLATLGEGVAAR